MAFSLSTGLHESQSMINDMTDTPELNVPSNKDRNQLIAYITYDINTKS